VSNVTGALNPVEEISRMAKEHDALLVLDASQSAPHLEIDVRKLGL